MSNNPYVNPLVAEMRKKKNFNQVSSSVPSTSYMQNFSVNKRKKKVPPPKPKSKIPKSNLKFKKKPKNTKRGGVPAPKLPVRKVQKKGAPPKLPGRKKGPPQNAKWSAPKPKKGSPSQRDNVSRQSRIMNAGINMFAPKSNPMVDKKKNIVTSSSGANVSGYTSSKSEDDKKLKLFSKRKLDLSFEDELKEAFFIFDFNGDGKIEKQILFDMIEEMNHERKNDMIRMIKEVNFVDFACFEKIMKKFFTLPYTSDELERLMNELGSENDEFYVNDFQSALMRISNEEKLNLNENEVKEVLEGIQSNSKLSIKKLCKEIGGI